MDINATNAQLQRSAEELTVTMAVQAADHDVAIRALLLEEAAATKLAVSTAVNADKKVFEESISRAHAMVAEAQTHAKSVQQACEADMGMLRLQLEKCEVEIVSSRLRAENGEQQQHVARLELAQQVSVLQDQLSRKTQLYEARMIAVEGELEETRRELSDKDAELLMRPLSSSSPIFAELGDGLNNDSTATLIHVRESPSLLRKSPQLFLALAAAGDVLAISAPSSMLPVTPDMMADAAALSMADAAALSVADAAALSMADAAALSMAKKELVQLRASKISILDELTRERASAYKELGTVVTQRDDLEIRCRELGAELAGLKTGAMFTAVDVPALTVSSAPHVKFANGSVQRSVPALLNNLATHCMLLLSQGGKSTVNPKVARAYLAMLHVLLLFLLIRC